MLGIKKIKWMKNSMVLKQVKKHKVLLYHLNYIILKSNSIT
jgi:hypothetical protein